MGTRGSFPGGEADHSLPSNAGVKNAWSYTSTPSYAFMAWCLVKAQRQILPFTFYILITRTGKAIAEGDVRSLLLKCYKLCGLFLESISDGDIFLYFRPQNVFCIHFS
jgi:hypothetical protein